ncbi:hypothetical protein C922_05053 [Plasmodium inui San Antonio 1]|uniref:Uncharacterized protein n=1 Tax=Plasmodium inui San Antonio 1 TaxID=1237626 RepID=W6ZUZ7_9APIC|nr:hypothetical protein C922_05053 [Plasmodium inui San Antonio 1]EUD64582.1 hypothetical protein C922_05053 [Plasmodium inui San Antonio 1]
MNVGLINRSTCLQKRRKENVIKGTKRLSLWTSSKEVTASIYEAPPGARTESKKRNKFRLWRRDQIWREGEMTKEDNQMEGHPEVQIRARLDVHGFD